MERDTPVISRTGSGGARNTPGAPNVPLVGASNPDGMSGVLDALVAQGQFFHRHLGAALGRQG
ncbi:MAG: hypothetical protein OES24_23625, partial [Acidimicrobiia bacterium]|nr:hypothetical protein [Acidimicrobiia bacterium]